MAPFSPVLYVALAICLYFSSQSSLVEATRRLQLPSESEIHSSHVWFKMWNSTDDANTICVNGVDQLDEENKSHFFVGSDKLSGKNYKLCSKMDVYSHKTDGERTTFEETSAPQIWRGVHWNSSAVSPSTLQASSQESHKVHLHNLSPVSLQVNGLKGQLMEAATTKKVEAKKSHFEETELKTLDWLTHLVAQYMVNKTSGFVDEEKVGTLKAAMIFHNFNGKEAEAGLTSRASYSLLQPTSPTTVAFHMMEASYKASPPKEEKRQRKLLQQSGDAFTLESTFACPKGYCFRLPKWKVSRTCKPGAVSYSGCLYRCVCN